MGDLSGFLDVSRETSERLKIFEGLVQKWSPKINLVSRDDLRHVWDRHIVDSAQILAHSPSNTQIWTDIGSGGGFPGIIVAIVLAERSPNCKVTMIESDQRKATFLRTALRECGITGQVIANRIEAAPPQSADVLSARALAPVKDLLAHAALHLNKNGIALLHKGRNYAQELEVACQNWTFDLVAHQSKTASDSRILEIGNIQRANAD